GYTTMEASNDATLQCRWEFKRNIRPWSRSLYVGVMKHFLKPGDTITVRFGDRRLGSPGIRLQTYCEAAFEFRVFVDAIATYDYVALPESPRIAIVPGPAATWQALLPTMLRVGDDFRLAVKATDKWGNATNHAAHDLILESNISVEGLPDRTRIEDGQYAVVINGLRVNEPGALIVTVRDSAGAEICHSNPMRIVEKDADYVHFWADTHGQSNETLGTNTTREYFEFGRDRAFLDVIGHQGNDFQITGAFWRELNALTREFDVAGKFVCIPGYEWSANTAVGGDRNVHYRNEGEAIHRSSHAQIWDDEDRADEDTDCHDAHDLFRKLRAKDCVVVAHVGGRYADVTFAHDGRLETAVEVHSAWGTFEWILRDAFEKNYRVGVVCNSDGHKGRPGADFPGASFFGATGGLTCFLAPRLDRDAIFEAMRRRHHYGTTGNRMILDVEVHLAEDGDRFLRDPMVFPDAKHEPSRRLIMGDIARLRASEVEFIVRVVGSAAIERVDIFDGLDLVETFRPYGKGELGSHIRMIYEGSEYRGRARTTIWDGSLSVAGNTILNATMINNWNRDRGIQMRTESEVTWKAVTTGNSGGIDVTLAAPDAGRLSINTRHVQIETAIADIGLEDMAFEAGGLERRVRLYRLPDRMSRCDVSVRRNIQLHDGRDTRLFVRVTQEDGHRAWSSPIYLFRG
ncbi:MAG: DUF3604 domain-containing protein, partial [Rhizobiales bacterium]|nr:DUF3604 domain-containing protein [Hyphomicrobiales bacterium]